MPGKTLALIVGLIVLTLVLLFASAQINKSGQQATPQNQTAQATTAPTTPTPTPPAYTTLSISPNPVILAATGAGVANVMIDTDKNEVQAVELEISYDPKALTNIALTPGDFFPNPVILIKHIEPTTGRITYALGITPAQKPVKGRGVVATITFTKLSGTLLSQTELTLMPKSLVTQSGVSSSVLKSQVGATVLLTPQQKQPVQQ